LFWSWWIRPTVRSIARWWLSPVAQLHWSIWCNSSRTHKAHLCNSCKSKLFLGRRIEARKLDVSLCHSNIATWTSSWLMQKTNSIMPLAYTTRTSPRQTCSSVVLVSMSMQSTVRLFSSCNFLTRFSWTQSWELLISCSSQALSPDVRSSSSLLTFKRRLKTELFSRGFPNWCDCVNFRYICKVASQLWLMPP